MDTLKAAEPCCPRQRTRLGCRHIEQPHCAVTTVGQPRGAEEMRREASVDHQDEVVSD